LLTSKESLLTSKKSFVVSNKSLVTSKKSLVASKKSLVTSKESLVASKESLVVSKESLVASNQFLLASSKKEPRGAAKRSSGVDAEGSIDGSKLQRDWMRELPLRYTRELIRSKGVKSESKLREYAPTFPTVLERE
jgi:hypothetical protein